MVSNVSSSLFNLMMFGSGTMRLAKFHTDSSNVAEKSNIWQLWGSILSNNREERKALRVCTSNPTAVNYKTCSPLDSDALVLVTLGGNHDISFIQHKYPDLFWVKKLKFSTPVLHRARGTNNNLFLELCSFRHCDIQTEKSKPSLFKLHL